MEEGDVMSMMDWRAGFDASCMVSLSLARRGVVGRESYRCDLLGLLVAVMPFLFLLNDRFFANEREREGEKKRSRQAGRKWKWV